MGNERRRYAHVGACPASIEVVWVLPMKVVWVMDLYARVVGL